MIRSSDMVSIRLLLLSQLSQQGSLNGRRD
jgi:hypothetical protein